MGIFHEFIYPNYLSISRITWKNGLIFKTTNQKKNFNTVHNLVTFSIVFKNKNRGGQFEPPPIKIKVYLPPIITKVNKNEKYDKNSSFTLKCFKI